jgi:hypothetical protein
MNLILFGISLYLLFQKRTIIIDNSAQRITLQKCSLRHTALLSITFPEIQKLSLGLDQVYSGFAVAGSSAAQTFPVPSLRLVAVGGESILLDRGSLRRLEGLASRVSKRVEKPLDVDPDLRG